MKEMIQLLQLSKVVRMTIARSGYSRTLKGYIRRNDSPILSCGARVVIETESKVEIIK